MTSDGSGEGLGITPSGSYEVPTTAFDKTAPSSADDHAHFVEGTSVEPRYTLAEARKVILPEICSANGQHELDIEYHVPSNFDGSWYRLITIIRCTRCGARFEETPR